jgi:RNA polymerase sigma-70 factor, ECF subfamily
MPATATLTKTVLTPDENAAQELVAVFSRCRSAFHRTAFRCLGNAADAEDAVQDALLSAYKHRDQFRGQAQLPTWITAIVVNSARMQLRRRRQVFHLPLNHEPEEAETSLLNLLRDPRPNPEQEYRASELADRAARVIALLSPPLRQAIQLREFEGLTIRDIASRLGLPEGTVKARISRARRKLRRLVPKTLGRRMTMRSEKKTPVVDEINEQPSVIRT